MDDVKRRLFEEVVGQHGHRIPDKQLGEQAQYRYWPYRQSRKKRVET